MSKAFKMMMAGMDDAIAYAQGDTSRGRVHRPVDVKAVRKTTKLTQAKFADTYRLPLRTLQDWEQERSQPEAGARVLLEMIGADPVGVQRIIAKAAL